MVQTKRKRQRRKTWAKYHRCVDHLKEKGGDYNPWAVCDRIRPPGSRRSRQRGKGAYQWVANRIFGAHLGPGEMHAPLRTKEGWRAASFMGPGTEVMERIRKGVQPIAPSDKVAKRHDLDYSLARSVKDIRDADMRMINKLRSLRQSGEDYGWNTWAGQLGIQSKVKLEDWGLMDPQKYGGDLKGFSDPADQALAEAEVAKLTQEGYGKRKRRRRRYRR